MLLFLHSDELDFSAARRPPELILGSMSTEHIICWSWKHKNNTPQVGIQTLFTLQTLHSNSNSNSNVTSQTCRIALSILRPVGFVFVLSRPTCDLFHAHRAQDELRRPPCGREIEFITIEDNEPGASASHYT